MAVTVFYSWQNDLDSRVTRQLIRDALGTAIEQLTQELSLEDAIRLDQDTQGIPGMPEIVTTILKKIEECIVFVPDLSYVAKTENGKKAPNPNVLIELGYAMRAKSDMQIMSVMNEAFGKASELPFDLANRRWPIRYELKKGAPREELREARTKLSSRFKEALRVILTSSILPNQREPEIFEGTQPQWRISSYLSDDEVLVREISDVPLIDDSPPRDVVWKNGPQAFLRLLPLKPLDQILSRQRLDQAVRKISPFGRVTRWDYDRNRYGSIAYAAPEVSSEEQKIALIITQIFRSGEIWGINGISLRKSSERPFIPTGVIIETFTRHLAQFMECARQDIGLIPPLRFIAGLSQIEGYQIALPSGYYPEIAGNCVEEDIFYEGSIENFDSEPEQLLEPFFDELWDACGVPKPER
jgi:hypothetical protein